MVEWDAADGALSVLDAKGRHVGVLSENVRRMTHVRNVLRTHGIVTGRWRANPRDTDGQVAQVRNLTAEQLRALCQ